MSNLTVFISTTPVYTASGLGYGRLYQNLAGTYLYRIRNGLLITTDFWDTVEDIVPSGIGYVSAITSAQNDVTAIVMKSPASITHKVFYREAPEDQSNWQQGDALPTLFAGSDAIYSEFNLVPLLIGNIHIGTESRIVRSDLEAPFSFEDSDTGIPQDAVTSSKNVGITDLDYLPEF